MKAAKMWQKAKAKVIKISKTVPKEDM